MWLSGCHSPYGIIIPQTMAIAQLVANSSTYSPSPSCTQSPHQLSACHAASHRCHFASWSMDDRKLQGTLKVMNLC